jgi:hypothetical protein
MECVDNTLLTLLFNPDVIPPDDPATQKPITQVRDRLNLLEKTWKETKERIIVPTPALAEFLIFMKADGPKYLDAIKKSSNFEIFPFDDIAAIELAARYYDDYSAQSKNEQDRKDNLPSKSKVKFDKQIVAIAHVNGAKVIYSDDGDILNYAKQFGIKVIRTWELPLPKLVIPAVAQPNMLDSLASTPQEPFVFPTVVEPKDGNGKAGEEPDPRQGEITTADSVVIEIGGEERQTKATAEGGLGEDGS